MSNLLDFKDNAFIALGNYKTSGTVLHSNNNDGIILAGTGIFKELINKNINDVFSCDTIKKLERKILVNNPLA